MGRRLAMGLAGLALLLGAAGCPAFLSDDWRISALDAGLPEGSGASGVETGTGNAAGDSGASDATTLNDSMTVGLSDGPQDAASEAPQTLDAAPEAACLPITATMADLCPGGNPATQLSTCFVASNAAWDAGGCSQVAACRSLPTQCACREQYTCACLEAEGQYNPSLSACQNVPVGDASAPWVY